MRRGHNNSHPRPLQLKKGPLTITLKSVKGGIMLDEFLLTTDREAEAQGAMTPTSQRAGDECGAAGQEEIISSEHERKVSEHVSSHCT